MKCNPLRWLWGVLPVALLGWFATQLEHTRIERDIEGRVLQELSSGGHKWARTGIFGRDLVLSGQATDEAEPGRAADIARNVWGVRVVDNSATLAEKIDKYVWSATHDGSRLTLGGFVPNDGLRGNVVTAARAAFPRADVVDQMKIARGSPNADTWLSGVNFGMKQLAGLRSGKASLDGLSVSVEGPATSLDSYRSVRTALASGMPRGLRLADEKITPPVVKPYSWSALSADNKLTLLGHVPNDRVRNELVAAAKAAFPRAALTDRMEPGDGAANGHAAAATGVLRVLASLEDGEASVVDNKIMLEGMAQNEAAATSAKSALRRVAPQGFNVADAIKFRDTGPKPVSPYTGNADITDGTIVITGYAPSDEVRKAIGDSARVRFPGRVVDNRLEIAPGAPDGWQRCFDAGFGGVSRLGGGRVALVDRRMDVYGVTDDEQLAAQVPNDVRAAAGSNCTADVKLELKAEAVPNLVWRADATGADIILEGDVPNVIVRDSLVNQAKRQFTGRQVVDRMRIVDTRTRLWPGVASNGLTALGGLKSGTAILDRGALSVSGEAANDDARSQARAAMVRDIPRQYSSRDTIRVAAAAPPPPPPPPAVRPPPAPPVAIAPPPPPPPAPPRVDPAVLRCQESLRTVAREGMIRFNRASADLSRDSRPTLERLAAAARACPNVRIDIEGHTDDEGTDERNQRLSDRRAKAIVDYLTAAGVATAKLAAVGYGSTRPLVPNDSAEGRAKNRRIEFSVTEVK